MSRSRKSRRSGRRGRGRPSKRENGCSQSTGKSRKSVLFKNRQPVKNYAENRFFSLTKKELPFKMKVVQHRRAATLMDLAEAAATCEYQSVVPVNLLILAEAAAIIDAQDRVATR